MNWNKDKSVTLSKISLWVFGVLLAAACMLTPWYGRILPHLLGHSIHTFGYAAIVLCFAVPAYIAIFQLYGVLKNIENKKIFTDENVRALRTISWCCFCGAAVFFAGVFYAPSCAIFACAAGFVGVILRVVKNVFEQAVALQNENDLTI